MSDVAAPRRDAAWRDADLAGVAPVVGAGALLGAGAGVAAGGPAVWLIAGDVVACVAICMLVLRLVSGRWLRAALWAPAALVGAALFVAGAS